MITRYDKEIDAKYVRVKEGKIAYTKPKTDWLILDFNKDGEVVGVEILNASKHVVNIPTIVKVFDEVGVPA
jgi:uncharacterized protein YuzE